MFWIALAFLSFYFFLFLIDEMWLRRRRSVGSREAKTRLATTIFHAAVFPLFCALPATFWTWPLFAGLASAAIVARLLADSDRDAHAPAAERLTHGVLMLLQIPLWILLAGTWEFIDGASALVGMVIPFSLKYLRPLCEGFALVWTGLFAAQAVLTWRALRAARLVALPKTKFSAPRDETSKAS